MNEADDMPMKIPAEVLLKLSRQEIGKLESYIDELEDTIHLLQKRIIELEDPNSMFSKQEKRKILKEIRAQEEFEALSQRVAKQQRLIASYKTTIRELLYRIAQGNQLSESQFELLRDLISRLLSIEGIEVEANSTT